MLVYRVENVKGGGPYNAHVNTEMRVEQLDAYFNARHLLLDAATDDDTCGHPNPYEDGIGLPMANGGDPWIFGFSSVEQLGRWFPERIRRAYNAAEFIISVYEVDILDCLVGRAQLAFDKYKAELVETRTLV